MISAQSGRGDAKSAVFIIRLSLFPLDVGPLQGNVYFHTRRDIYFSSELIPIAPIASCDKLIL